MSTTETEPVDLAAELAMVTLQAETLAEALADARDARLFPGESAQWGGGSGVGVDGYPSRDWLRARTIEARLAGLVDPLIRRGIGLLVDYVWGNGVEVSVKEADEGQDVNAVVQGFLADPSNVAAFSGSQAREEFERGLRTDGERFLALFTSPLSGRVQVRVVPCLEVTDVVTNPDDADEVWFYKREHVVKTLVSQGNATTYHTENRTTYYPDVRYRPRRGGRTKTLDGHPIRWDAPIAHLAVNRVRGRGTPDVLAALPWAAGYQDFLRDWALYMKALSRFAFRATSATARGAQQTRAALATRSVDATGQPGAVVTQTAGSTFEAIGKSGAAIDADSGRPLAAMVASALSGIPVTMLLADPGVTGARATAETLSDPLRNAVRARQRLHGELISAVCNHVVQEAIRAPLGALKGTITRDPLTDIESAHLAGDELYTVEVAWPTADDIDVKTLLEALNIADQMDKIPPELLARLVLAALGAQDIDGWMDKLTTKDGEFFPPSLRAALQGPGAAYANPGAPPPEPAA